MIRHLLLLSSLFFLPTASCLAEDTSLELPAVEQEAQLPGEGPLRRYDNYVKKWKVYRPRWAAQVAQQQGSVVFLGDSITEAWKTDFRKLFPGMKLANRGIGGDTTRGMLLRMKEDVLALNPSAVVLLMGTNDIGVDIPADAIGRNFEKIIAALKDHNPNMPIILCRMFPSSESKNRSKEQIATVNALYDAAVKGDSQVTVLDTYTLFADANGDARSDLFPDLLHLNNQGYERWAAALRPIFATLKLTETESKPFVPDEGFVSLFNGKDLTGWEFRPTPPRKQPKKPRPNAPVFVEIKQTISFDGQIESNDHRYQAINGRLVVTTPAEGRRIQQLWTTKDFTGDFILKLQFRATPNADSGVFLYKPQLQCRDYLLAGPYKDLKNFREGDWNDLHVTVKNGIATATCNGELLTDEMQIPDSGPIGLEGDRGQMEYRHIQIQTMK